ncbi:MAG: hypothetical protein U0Q18_03505 [Bryobacteraceae bacterium]
MAGLRAILTALRRAVKRDLDSLEPITTNNLFLFVLLLVYGALNSGQKPKSAEPFFVLFGFLLLFSLSADPLARIPPARLHLWPLSRMQFFALRCASLVFSPVVWIAAAIVLKTGSARLGGSFVGLALAIQVAAVLGKRASVRDPHWNLLRYVPPVPGRLGGMIRKNVRELLSLLDPYSAAALSLGGAIYRFSGAATDPFAFGVIGLLVCLALSTYAQSLFGLELETGVVRYRLLPLSGWEILLSKDLAFLLILAVLLLPLNPWPGLTFGFAALAVGHHSSVLLRIPHQRWRFTGGLLLPVGLIQAVGGMALGFAELQRGMGFFGLAFAGYLVSLYLYGRQWDAGESRQAGQTA